ncbi:hypothetical protein AgCh_034812 [Apium graveolens]
MDATPVEKSWLKRTLEQNPVNDPGYEHYLELLQSPDEEVLACIQEEVEFLRDNFSSSEVDQVSESVAIILGCTRVDEYVHLAVLAGAVPVLVRLLSRVAQINEPQLYEHEIARDCALALALIATKAEYHDLIVGVGALPSLINVIRRNKSGQIPQARVQAMTRAANAIMNLAENNSRIQSCVRSEHGIPLLVELLEFPDSKVQRAATGALGNLSYDDDENQNQIVECNALPALVLLLYCEDVSIHYEAVRVIVNLAYSSLENKKKALEAGALQPLIRLLSSRCLHSQKEAAIILGQFALTEAECKVHMVQRGAIDPLIKLVKSQDVELQEFSAFALGLLAQDTHSRAGIAQSGGVVPLLNLLDSNIEQVQQNAAYALSELAKDEDNVVDIIVAGGVQKLKDGEYLVEETRNYVSDTLDTLEEKMNEQVLRHLLYLMRIADRSIQERIGLTLSHLCLPDDQKSIFANNNGLDILLDLLASTDLKLQRLASEALYVFCPMDTGPTSPISQFGLGEEHFNNPRGSDVTFLVEGKRFYAHRTRLLAASDAFRAIFGGGGYREREAKDIEISDIKWEVFELMIRYIYVGSVHVTLNVAYDLLEAADKYHLDGLKHQCEHFIAQDLSLENVSRTYDLSVALSASSLRDACFVFVLENFNDLTAYVPGSRCLHSQKEAAIILRQFALTKAECKVHMVQRGAIDPLIKLVKSQDVELQEFSAFALGLLAQDTHSRAGIAQSGGVVPLLNLLDSNIEQVQQNAAYALSELAKDEDNAVDIIVAGGVQKLKDGEYLVEETRNYVSDTLDTLEEKMNEQVLRHLLYLMRIADRSIQERIALTLSHLCLPDDQKSIFVNNNGLDILLDLLASTDLNSNDLHQRLYTSYARWTQVRHPQSHRIVF